MNTRDAISVDNLIELQALTNMLMLARGFALGIVRINHISLRERIVARLRSSLGRSELIEVNLEGSSDLGVVSQLQTGVRGGAADAMFVYGIEHLLDLRTRQSAAMYDLNINRDFLARSVPMPIIFWMPEFAMRELSRQAPDFWSWRSGTYHFVGDERDAYQTIQHMALGFNWSLGLKEKRERRQILMHLLVEADSVTPADSRAIARICELLGQAANFEGESDAGVRYLSRALELNQQDKNEAGQARCLQYLGEASWATARFDDATVFFEAATSTFVRLNDDLGRAYCLRSLGGVAIRRDEYVRAQQLFNDSLVIFQRIPDKLGEANCIRNLGDVARKLDRYAEAEEFYEEALHIYRAIPDRLGEANCIRSLVELLLGEIDMRKPNVSMTFQYLSIERLATLWGLPTASRG